jgi:hypothetical protein
MLAAETTLYLSLLDDVTLAKMLKEYERKMLQFLEAMDPLHYTSGRYIDLKVDLERHEEGWQGVYKELKSRKG